jgi:hypothetical protein
MHQTISDYAHSHLSPMEENRACERLLAFLQQALEMHADDFSWMESESQVILCALDGALRLGKMDLYIRFVLLLAPFWLAQGWLHIAYEHIQQAFEEAPHQAHPVHTCWLHWWRGSALLRLAQVPEGLHTFYAGLEWARLAHEPACSCEILVQLSWHTLMAGKLSEADALIKEGIEIA